MRPVKEPSTQPKVIVRIIGGLGNQLFAYAAARRIALLNNAELVIDHVSGFRYDTQYQRQYQLDHFAIPCRKATPAERLEPFSRGRRYLLRRWNQRRPFERRRYLTHEFIDFDERLLYYRLTSGSLYLEGYWQSEGYFKDVTAQIRQDLRIHPPTDAANLACAEHIQQRNAVAVHVRFFDEPSPNVGEGGNTPGGYHVRAIQTMEAQVSNAHYFLFSDRPAAARSGIPLPDNRVTLVHHNLGDSMAYADLWLMTQCRHFIIANSSFSWWGAWLAAYPTKVIIAPGFEKREGVVAWGFEGLLPQEWLLI